MSGGHSRLGKGGIFYYGLSTTMGQISDGTSNTYLCGEKSMDANHYPDGLDGTIGGQYYGYDSDCICDYCGYDSGHGSICRSNDVDLATPGYTPQQDWAGFSDERPLRQSRMPACATWPSATARCIRSATGSRRRLSMQLGNRADGTAIDASMY